MTEAARLVTVSPETTLKAVAGLMLERRVSGVPVIDGDGRVVGVISEADVVRGETGGTGGEGMIARARAVADAAALSIPRTAAEAMTSPAVTISPDATVMEAAHQIAERGVNRLPVVDEDGRLIGIIARADVLRAFARADDEIAEGIREEIQRTLGSDAGAAVQVAVDHGEVVLSGEVDTDTNARLAAFFATRVPGVVAVRSELTARDPGDARDDRADDPSSN